MKDTTNKKKQKNAKKEPDVFQTYLAEYLYDQVVWYHDHKDEENAISKVFRIENFHMEIPNSPYIAYLMERNVRMEKDANGAVISLERISCAITVIDPEMAAPVYYCTAYLNKKGAGNVVVMPYNNKGPQISKMHRINFSLI